MDLFQLTVTNDLGSFFCFFLCFKCRSFSFLLMLAYRGYSVGNKNCDKYACGFIPIRFTHEEQYNLYCKRNKKYYYHRVCKAFEEFFPQWFRRYLCQIICAVFTSAFLNFSGTQACQIHKDHPFLYFSVL